MLEQLSCNEANTPGENGARCIRNSLNSPGVRELESSGKGVSFLDSISTLRYVNYKTGADRKVGSLHRGVIHSLMTSETLFFSPWLGFYFDFSVKSTDSHRA